MKKSLFMLLAFASFGFASANMVACTLEYAPVCGSDGQTYGNTCMANAASGVNILYPGECLAQEEMNNCSSFFDGCNTCMVEDGQIGGCTRMYCETYETPQCLAEIEASKLSENDQNFLDHIRTTLDESLVSKADQAMEHYATFMSKMTDTQQTELTNFYVGIIEKLIAEMLMQYPQDAALPEATNKSYLFWSMIKLEMMSL